MSNQVISIENLSKRYVLGQHQVGHDGIRHVLEALVRAPFALLHSKRRKKPPQPSDFWALKNVTLNIGEGEVVGIIGRNGAGKSTLLKILSRITVPTEGRIRISGRIASLLEVGTGFHQELTGRENIFLNGAILGMSRAEITRKFDEIVAFSEIETFLDTPVKRYSSGMYVRLAFSVAAHLEPEILIVDEVLAVGDGAFQKKCVDKMGTFAKSGRTVLFVSHNMEAVRSLCQRAVLLKNGQLERDGLTDDVVQEYLNEISGEQFRPISSPDFGLVINGVTLRNSQGEATSRFCPGEDLVVEISYDAMKSIEHPAFILGVTGLRGSCFTAQMLLDGHRPEVLSGPGKLACRFKAIPLLPQNYTIKMEVRAKTWTDMIIEYQDVASFNVVGDLAEYGFKGEYLMYAARSTPVIVPYEWLLPDGATVPVSLNLPTR